MAERDLILALDLATRTGWALVGLDGTLHGWGHFLAKPTRSLSRWTRLRRQLSLICSPEICERLAAVVTEKAITYGSRGRSAAAARVAFGMRAHAEHWAERRGVPRVEELPPATVKREAAGRGNAKKEQVAEAVAQVWPQAAEEIRGLLEADGPFDGTDALAVAWSWLKLNGHA